MIRLAIAQLRSRKRRLIGTGLAIVIGVAFLSGTLVLGDTLSANFDRLFTDVSAGTDVVVRNATSVDPDAVIDSRGPVPATLIDTVARVPGVAVAEAQVIGYGSLLGADGKAIGGNGPPRQAGSWIADPALNPYKLVEGRAPVGPEEVVVNRGAAKEGKLHLGDTATVQTPDPVTITIVGIATFGDADGLGTATWTAFTLDGAQRHVTHRSDAVSTVLVKAAPGTASTELRDRVAAALPADAQAITGKQLANERIDDISKQFLGMLRTFLTVFALVALLVGGITIANTFSITLAQRTREVALLRAVGASRRQVRRSVTVEAMVIGVVCSAVGVVAGLGVAGLLKGLFDAAGGALPAGGLTIKPGAALLAFAAGVGVTVLAARAPARRAARVAPVAALRDDGDGTDVLSSRRTVIGLTGVVAGVVLATIAAQAGATPLAGLGALLLLVGALIAAPVAVGPASRVFGAALRLARRPGVELAEGGVRRHPRRTSATATALVVGVAVVSLFTVFAASLKSSIDEQVRGSFRADLAVNTAAFGGSQLSPAVLDELRTVPGASDVVGLGTGAALFDGRTSRVTATDVGAVDRVLALRTSAGTLADVGDDGIAISQTRASDRSWSVGTQVPVTFADGKPLTLTVRAIYADDQLAGPVLVPAAVWSSHSAQPTLRTVLITAAPGTSVNELRAAVSSIADRFGGDVQDAGQLASATSQGLDTLLGVVYVLLALAILVALLGIANALSLAVHERRREIGLLRAVGQTRRQVRQVLRLEALMVAAFGTVTGIVLGSFLGWSLFGAVSTSQGFTLPVGRLLIVAVVGAVAGAAAARRPAKRAARVPILDAIAMP